MDNGLSTCNPLPSLSSLTSSADDVSDARPPTASVDQYMCMSYSMYMWYHTVTPHNQCIHNSMYNNVHTFTFLRRGGLWINSNIMICSQYSQ